jgi:hypothetical protein
MLEEPQTLGLRFIALLKNEELTCYYPVKYYAVINPVPLGSAKFAPVGPSPLYISAGRTYKFF